MPVSIVRDRAFLDHYPGSSHVECPERLVSIDRAIEDSALELVELAARAATIEELTRVHDGAYVASLLELEGRSALLDADTMVSPGSIRAALFAAGGSVDLANAVAEGRAPPGLALVRPPGHHATRDRAMGFCLLNNVAIAAAAVRARGLARRIAIYDFDIHHGNGTEAIFDEDPDVLYMSTHEWPQYPGTGARDYRGRGRGKGATINVPLPAGTDDRALLLATDEILAPRVREFRPDLILVSAGFDPYERDPIGGFRITVDGFGELARRWGALAAEVSAGRICGVLEGGYDLDGLGACVVAVLRAWQR